MSQIVPLVHFGLESSSHESTESQDQSTLSSPYARLPSMFYFRQGPLYSTVCGGISPSAVGIWRTVVSLLPGYCVK